ncbi:MAG TPA: hypothetical protein ENN08_06680 [Bacteroidales bacterium]|nr:hypothetical protein [Bacteroidales bacterium]
MGWINKIIGGIKKAIGWITRLYKHKDGDVEVVAESAEERKTTDTDGGFIPGSGEADIEGSGVGSAMETIAGGGAKQTHINVVIERLIENFNFKADQGQSWMDVERIVVENLTRILNSMNRSVA